jgi:adenylate cyclase
VQALRCTIAIQEQLGSEPEGLRLRIGVHQGEVVAEGDDLLGDGVIIAARLEPLAEPGGICISARVREDAAGKMALEVDDLGTPELKNIAAKIQVFRVRLGRAERPALPLPDKPSIAVLAFTNMSGDLEQEYFSDGIADDIITELSRSRSLFVIARNSSFTYKGRAVDIKQVGRELGVRYVLEGSVRRSGDRVRVVAQLIEAETGHHIWGERYDRSVEDVFVVQDEITVAVVTAIQPAVAEAEVRRVLRKAPGNLGAWELYQRGLWHMSKCNHTDNTQAQEYFRSALKLDETLSRAQSAMAVSFFAEGAYAAQPLPESTERGCVWAQRSVDTDPGDADAQSILALGSMLGGNFDDVFERVSLGLASNPNSFWANATKGTALVFSGHPAEGRELVLRAQRLSPHDPSGGLFPNVIALSFYFERDYAQTVASGRRVVSRYPNWHLTYRWLAAALGQLGRSEEAHEALQKALSAAPSAIARYTTNRPPWFRPEDHEHMLDGLRKAGWQG